MLKKFLKNAVVKNTGWLIGGKVVQMLVSFLVGMLTTRYLGPSNYGLINYANAYTAFFMSFCTLGINSVLVNEFVNNKNQEGQIIGSSLVYKGISSFCSAAGIICFVSIIEADEKAVIGVTALCSIGLIFNIFDTFNYWFQSRLQSKVPAMVLTFSYILTAIYKIILMVLDKSVYWFAFANAFDYICIGILLIISYKRYGGNKLSFSKEVGKRILKKSVHFILPGLMVSIYGYSDRVMLRHFIDDASVGYYSSAVAVCSIWTFVLSAIIDSMYPIIMKAYNQDIKLFEKKNRQLYAIVFYISLFVSVFICLFSELIVTILYGEKFLPSAEPLRIITWYTAFSYLGVARNIWTVCEKKQNKLKYIYISAAVVNIILNLFFIPTFGATGAAVASLITQLTTVLVIPFAIKDMRKNAILMLEGILLKGIR